MAGEAHLCDILWGDGQEVDLVGQSFRRLHGGDIGVDQHCLGVLLLQRLDRLRLQNNLTWSFETNLFSFAMEYFITLSITVLVQKSSSTLK